MVNSIYEITVRDAEQRSFKLEELKGKVLLIVNVASKCGLAERSYHELADLLAKYHSRGLRILLFPCSQFLNQEYSEIKLVREFARQYSEDFMLMDAVNVKGPKIHPLFQYLTDNLKGFLVNTVKWNFTYFLVGRNGELLKRYGPTERLPDTDPVLVEAIGDSKEEFKKTSGKIKVDFSSSDSNTCNDCKL